MRNRLRPARIARGLSNARRGATSLLLGMLAAARIARHTMSAGGLGLVLLFHRVAEQDGDPRRELVPAVGVARFHQQLRWTRRIFRPVAADEILAAARSRRRWHRIPIAITFDDEWSTHTTLALPALRAEGLRATFFLTGAQLDGPSPFWWESLQETADEGKPTSAILAGNDIFEQAATATEALPEERAAFTSALAALAPSARASSMSPDDIRQLAAEQDIGFHTLRHDRFDRLTDAQLRAALLEGRERLERLVGRPLSLLAYPHGAAGAREARAAEQAGFSLAFTTRWTPCEPDSEPFLIGRIEPGPVSLSGFLRVLAATLGHRGAERASRADAARLRRRLTSSVDGT
jgi:peptidoglycan/xylan/chitin deacetylase (PgdA/CDA1 family)